MLIAASKGNFHETCFKLYVYRVYWVLMENVFLLWVMTHKVQHVVYFEQYVYTLKGKIVEFSRHADFLFHLWLSDSLMAWHEKLWT